MSKGSSIVEVLVSVVILLMFITYFTRVLDSNIRYVKDSKQITKAVIASKSILEELKSVNYNDLPAYNNKKFDNGKGRISIWRSGNDKVNIDIKHIVEFNTIRSRY